MQLTFFLKKLFFLTFLLLFCSSSSFQTAPKNKNNVNIYFDKKEIKTLNFAKKNQYFSFSTFNKIFFSNKEKIIIKNDNYIGFFHDNRFKIFYIVKPKDTLYSIAKNSGHNYHELSKFNFIKKPYKIIIGQKIWIGDVFINTIQNNCYVINVNKNIEKEKKTCKIFFKRPFSISNFLKNNIKNDIKSTKICFFCDEELKKDKNIFNIKPFIFSNKWNWPIKSTNIKYFYKNELGNNKKLEISGFKGQPIFAAAAGEVVCVTDLFKTYGQLIIIRHNANYLSIYAFNNSVLVKEKEKVHENQQIATMGLSPEKNLNQLYFEIRYKGESINPLNVLPKIHR